MSERRTSPYGIHDMSGNVWEWTHSVYTSYPYVQSDGRERVEHTGELRVLRGGSFGDNENNLRGAARYRDFPADRSAHIDFRVVSSHIRLDL